MVMSFPTSVVLAICLVGVVVATTHRESFSTFNNEEHSVPDGPPQFYVHESIALNGISFLDLQKGGEYFVVLFQPNKTPPEYFRNLQKLLRGVVDVFVFPCLGDEANNDSDTGKVCKQHFRGAPLIKLFRGESEVVHKGEFNTDALALWSLKERSAALDKLEEVEQERLRKQYSQYRGGGAVTALDSEDGVLTFITGATFGGKAAVIGYFDSPTSRHYHTFSQIASNLREEGNYGAIVDPSLAEKFNVLEFPTVFMYPSVTDDDDVPDNESDLDAKYYGNDEQRIPYEGESFTDEPAMMRWVVENTNLPITMLTHDAFMTYATTGHHMLVMCIDEFADPRIQDEERGQLLATLDTMKEMNIRLFYSYESFREDMKTPYVILLDVEKKVDYVYPPDRQITPAGLVEFGRKFKRGGLKRTPRSEPPPVKNDGPVMKLVAREWDKLVFDVTKDVVVVFRTADCKPCHKFSSIYERIAKSLAHIHTLRFLEMDVEANEIDTRYELKGVPSIFVFPAGNTDKHSVFEGSRSFKNVVKFIRDNADIKFDIPVSQKQAQRRDEL